MSKISRQALIAMMAVLISSCAVSNVNQRTPTVIAPFISTVTLQPTLQVLPPSKLTRHPEAIDFTDYYMEIDSIPKYDPTLGEQGNVELRSRDLTKIDATGSLSDLMYANFDSKTQWPPASKLPAGFDPEKILEMNKDPGLGIKNLHEQGITGKGIGIAIIDQPPLVDHQEYKDRLRFYEEINVLPDEKAKMHGAAVSSIAVGKTTGVAPDANLYYIGSWPGDWDKETNNFTYNFKYYADAVHRILELNRSLPEDQKIRVITMQVGWDPSQAGYEEVTASVNEAKEAGILVVSSSLYETYGWNFHGLGREPVADPNDFSAYKPGLWWQQEFFNRGSLPSNTLLIPMESRTVASPTGTEDYVFYREGGWSWSIPYIAGMYALAVQVDPQILPEEFWEAALKTGKTIPIQHEGKEYSFGVILDPQALIDEIKSK
jgi:hypothetical protein